MDIRIEASSYHVTLLDVCCQFQLGLQDSSKGGAVETGCSGLHYIIGCFVRYNTTPIHRTPPPTACPFDEHPGLESRAWSSYLVHPRPRQPLGVRAFLLTYSSNNNAYYTILYYTIFRNPVLHYPFIQLSFRRLDVSEEVLRSWSRRSRIHCDISRHVLMLFETSQNMSSKCITPGRCIPTCFPTFGKRTLHVTRYIYIYIYIYLFIYIYIYIYTYRGTYMCICICICICICTCIYIYIYICTHTHTHTHTHTRITRGGARRRTFWPAPPSSRGSGSSAWRSSGRSLLLLLLLLLLLSLSLLVVLLLLLLVVLVLVLVFVWTLY